jgi:hypothetical protein
MIKLILKAKDKSTGGKGRQGLVAKKVQATRGGKTFQTTVYVRQGEKPKDDKQKKGDDSKQNKQQVTQAELDKGLAKWVQDYYDAKSAGNTELAESLKQSIDKKIAQKDLNSRVVWASAGPDGGAKEREKKQEYGEDEEDYDAGEDTINLTTASKEEAIATLKKYDVDKELWDEAEDKDALLDTINTVAEEYDIPVEIEEEEDIDEDDKGAKEKDDKGAKEKDDKEESAGITEDSSPEDIDAEIKRLQDMKKTKEEKDIKEKQEKKRAEAKPVKPSKEISSLTSDMDARSKKIINTALKNGFKPPDMKQLEESAKESTIDLMNDDPDTYWDTYEKAEMDRFKKVGWQKIAKEMGYSKNEIGDMDEKETKELFKDMIDDNFNDLDGEELFNTLYPDGKPDPAEISFALLYEAENYLDELGLLENIDKSRKIPNKMLEKAYAEYENEVSSLIESGDIVVTDEIIEKAEDGDIMSVLIKCNDKAKKVYNDVVKSLKENKYEKN